MTYIRDDMLQMQRHTGLLDSEMCMVAGGEGSSYLCMIYPYKHVHEGQICLDKLLHGSE